MKLRNPIAIRMEMREALLDMRELKSIRPDLYRKAVRKYNRLCKELDGR